MREIPKARGWVANPRLRFCTSRISEYSPYYDVVGVTKSGKVFEACYVTKEDAELITMVLEWCQAYHARSWCTAKWRLWLGAKLRALATRLDHVPQWP